MGDVARQAAKQRGCTIDRQLGHHAKPIFLLNVDGYWSAFESLVEHAIGHGFAGGHLVGHLRGKGDEPVVPARSELDLLDRDAVRSALRELRPGRVFHLAAIASAARSCACR